MQSFLEVFFGVVAVWLTILLCAGLVGQLVVHMKVRK